ncbi:MAG TPA: DUF790 family protein, partial [Kofleriaceae bacterium]|nr:DUF790 family protein [Kofleriaceae bacterium]
AAAAPRRATAPPSPSPSPRRVDGPRAATLRASVLTADLVRARRHKGELRLRPHDARTRAAAEETAAALIAVADDSVGQPRAAFDEACAAVVAAADDARLAAGLAKLVEDRATFEASAELEPEELRRDVFARASAARRALPPGDRLDRDAVLADVARDRGLTAADVEAALYADLRAAHRMIAFAPIAPAALVAAYDEAQAQAVLLRAVKVTVEVECAAADDYRRLFRQLKFQRLLHTIAPRAGGGYRIEIDGPYSLFESVTRYGLALALALPAIRACARWRLDADLRWGAARTALAFHLEGKAIAAELAPLPEELAALVRAVAELDTPWRAAPADALLDLPGVGVCAPDLVFTHGGTGESVYVEVLGYWSRAAVWRRVELVERGLADRVVFAVGQHLRVSEEALAGELPGALHVYKRTLQARPLVEAVDRVARAPVPARRR